jgi:hypothetical protein
MLLNLLIENFLPSKKKTVKRCDHVGTIEEHYRSNEDLSYESMKCYTLRK